MIVVRNDLQAIFGIRSEGLKIDMEEYLNTAGPEAEVTEEAQPVVKYAAMGIAPKLRDPDAAKMARGFLKALGGGKDVKGVSIVG